MGIVIKKLDVDTIICKYIYPAKQQSINFLTNRFLPRHPPSHITRLQNDGSRVQEKIEKVENAFDEVLPIGMKLVRKC